MRRFLSNVVLNVAYQVLNIIIPIVTAPYIARVMTPNEIGIYSYSNSISGVVAVLMLLGMANYGSRTIALSSAKGKYELSKVFCELFSLQSITSLVGIVLFVYIIYTSDSVYKKGLYTQFFCLIAVCIDVSWYFTGTGQFKYTVTRSSVIKLLQTISIFVFVKDPEDVFIYMLIMSVGTLAGNMILWIPLYSQVVFERPSIHRIMSHIRPNLVLFVPLLASCVYTYMDKIMLGTIKSSADLGLYEYAEKIVKIPTAIISAIGAVMIPTMAKLVADNNLTKYKNLFLISMRYISLFSSAMFFGLVSIAPELVEVYLGSTFVECTMLIQIMSIIILISSFASIIFTQLLMPKQKDKEYICSVIWGAAINFFLNSLLIPLLGNTGAVVGTICAEFTVLIGYLIGSRRELDFKVCLSYWRDAIICGMLMFMVVEATTRYIESSIYSLLLGIVVGIISFLILAFVMLWKRKDPIVCGYLQRMKAKNENE